MTRLFAAVTLTLIAAAPAFACEYNKSVSNAQPKTVASQPAGDQASPPSGAASNQKS